jgi:hypothetical protein
VLPALETPSASFYFGDIDRGHADALVVHIQPVQGSPEAKPVNDSDLPASPFTSNPNYISVNDR